MKDLAVAVANAVSTGIGATLRQNAEKQDRLLQAVVQQGNRTNSLMELALGKKPSRQIMDGEHTKSTLFGDEEAGARMIAGTARSMGIEVAD